MARGIAEQRTENACGYGNSGHCSAGRHTECAHRPGGEQPNGVRSPSAYLCDNRGRVWNDAGRHWPVGPWHLWRCACDCHADPQAVLGTLW